MREFFFIRVCLRKFGGKVGDFLRDFREVSFFK